MKLEFTQKTTNEGPRGPIGAVLFFLCQDAMQARLVDLLHSIIQVCLVLPETTSRVKDNKCWGRKGNRWIFEFDGFGIFLLKQLVVSESVCFDMRLSN